MSKRLAFSVIESPTHPKLSDLYDEMGYEELQFKSVRKAMSALKKHKPDVIAAEFFYAFGTNYSSNHICNLDSLLITLQRYPDYQPKIILFVSKREYEFVSKLEAYYGGYFHADYVLVQPVCAEQVRPLL
ncbi:MAG: hypothetical protein KZQ64_09830 [gamma proteobacterium symbiont of Bathyaustriella thionipta]|nr:hypothetical protein [gamma proteobacterium symbiont of Bathyaustriella thionipta]MCU7949246.1 hypothetical protein [gamma proteobacterium symbiont of Bathyaustriella thionipta]MCU7953670.1 hypothetical protein [gamma proteobacterium symbiont of Bathyaustriella thionipta]MCU7955834.1 hypothetical protein [gamma proteobacterium symbiont of Bathyaustriella thionipta]MCU7966938.1 hypothetical protein [gamma proteobacterium symbiont of Bathyaustriella thionipta]